MELKPCPFCGHPVTPVKDSLFGWHKKDCFFQFLDDESEVDFETEEEIREAFIKAWNRRASEKAEKANVRCL